MMYCTKCGSDLKGASKLCPVCGYEISKMKTDLTTPRLVRSSRDEPRAWAAPIPDQRKDKEQLERRKAAREPVRWGTSMKRGTLLAPSSFPRSRPLGGRGQRSPWPKLAQRGRRRR